MQNPKADGDFQLKDAVSLLSSQRSALGALWAFYAVACYSAAGFPLPAHKFELVALGVTIAFWILAMGHLGTVRAMLAVNVSLASQIASAAADGGTPFKQPLQLFGTTSVSPNRATAAHVSIAICVTFVLWVRATCAV